ncbi:hypothetical protein [Treponema sp.]|uniref:hypothetical protein n=1 Tax=Treponema sp. TaxID=166 RepID=UPI003FA311FA
MHVNKKIMDTLSKCYSIAPLRYNNEDCIIVAAEKSDPCYLYGINGEKKDTVWTEPGGTMSIVQIPESNGEFLATHRFYSPNDGAQAKIVYVTPSDSGWMVRTLVELPFVHRFDIIRNKGINWLFACTLKSGHEYKDDWSSPGKVYAAVLPDDIASCIEEQSLQLKPIKEGLLKNHGYTRDEHRGVQTAIVSADNGVFRFTPPDNPSGEWQAERLLDCPASDAIFADLDNDGKKELCVMSPFHGDEFSIYAEREGEYRRVYVHPEPLEFLHAVASGQVCGKQCVIIGHRKGKRNLYAFSYDEGAGSYRADLIDSDTGAANVYLFKRNGTDVLIVANREIDEIALYELFP